MLTPMKKLQQIILLSACLIIISCARISHTPVAINKTDATTAQTDSVKVANKPAPFNNAGVAEFLSFAEDYSNFPPEMQKQALLSTNQALSSDPSDLLARMKLVLIYGHPTSNVFDGAKAQSLLQQLIQDNNLSNSELAFANLLLDHLLAINKANKNIKEDQKRIDSVLQKNEVLQLKLETTQQKLDAALQKLNELKNIEKSMSERELTPRK